jgi:hypothetical protein
MVKYLFFVLGMINGYSGSQDLRKNRWETTNFIWNMGLSALSDKGVHSSPIKFFKEEDSPSFDPAPYQNIQRGDIVWLKCRFVASFYREIFPQVKHPFVLVINDGDESFPSQCGLSSECLQSLLSSDRIIHIFAQNCDLREPHPKVTLLPIGLDFHTIAYKGPKGGWGEIGSPLQQESDLKQILQTLPPTHLRKIQAFVDFQFSDSIRGGEHKRYLEWGEDRTSIFHRLLPTGLIAHGNWMRRSELWKTKGKYAFSISPHGNGLDCHRTWEDLILGCIVIVKTSSLDPLYEGLPVVIVQDWSEITVENMKKWKELYKDAFTNPSYREKLTHHYWMEKIRAAAKPYKELF